MRPSAAEVMKTIIWTFDEIIMPNPTSAKAQSEMLTVSNLLRHVLLRMEQEGPALVEESIQLRRLLADIVSFTEDKSELGAIGESITRDLAQLAPIDSGPLRTVLVLSEENDLLGWTLTAAIEAMHAIRDRYRNDRRYAKLREAIMSYLDNQLAREAAWIDPAFIRGRR
jgi:hypothetical protein